MTFIKEMLCYLYILIHRRMIGELTVVSEKTDKYVELTFEKEGGTYTFSSQQFRYVTRSTGWIKYKSVVYLYEVRLKASENTIVDYTNTIGLYFSNSPKFLKNSTYPHRLAINTHFKRVSEGEGHINVLETYNIK